MYLSINEQQTLHKDSRGSRIHLRNNIVPLSPSMCSSLFLFFSLSLSASSFPPSFPNALSFHYIALLHCILTIHFYLTPFHFRHLLPFTSEEGGGRNLLSCGLHCLGHFLINAVDKTTVFQLMRMQQAIPGLKHPSPLSSTLLILTSF